MIKYLNGLGRCVDNGCRGKISYDPINGPTTLSAKEKGYFSKIRYLYTSSKIRKSSTPSTE
jgi:hypothetical protein